MPLIIRCPGEIEPGSATDRLVSFIDFGPTTLSIAGVEVPAWMEGKAFLGEQATEPRRYVHAARDRMDETYDLIRAVRDRRFKYIRNYQPEKPYAQHLGYMDQMPTMREWRRLNAEGKLEGPQKIFFEPTKPLEELYDTQADPHEINNLAGDPAHAETLSRLRAEHVRWTRETGDLGHTPDIVLMERMRPEGRYQTTAPVRISPRGGRFRSGPVRVRLSCASEGASIAYTTKAGNDPRWKLYSDEIELVESTTLRTKAIRYGYRESAETVASFRL